MDERVQRALREVRAAGLENELIESLIPHMSYSQLTILRMQTQVHADRYTMSWRDADNNRIIITKLEDMHLYHILKRGMGGRRSKFHYKLFNALRLEAEVRGILVNGKLEDPSIQDESRQVPYHLRRQLGL